MARAQDPVVESLRRAHEALVQDLQKLEVAARPSAPGGPAELQARLAATRTHVTEHFRFEEEGGYLGVVRQREPRLERVIGQLAEEHRRLARSLDLLLTRAEATAHPEEPLWEGVRAWVEAVRAHEAFENRLVQDAFDLDLGAED